MRTSKNRFEFKNLAKVHKKMWTKTFKYVKIRSGKRKDMDAR